ncbi:MAG: hypothetical protein ROR55_22105 [Devosia sp.]
MNAFDPARADDYVVVATVTRAFHCANHIKTDETFVFDLSGRLDPQRSTANLCLGILAKLQPALLMAQDRAAEGLHPVSRAFRTFDCFDTGIDHGGTGKVYVELHLVEKHTGARVPRPDEVS